MVGGIYGGRDSIARFFAIFILSSLPLPFPHRHAVSQCLALVVGCCGSKVQPRTEQNKTGAKVEHKSLTLSLGGLGLEGMASWWGKALAYLSPVRDVLLVDDSPQVRVS